MSKQFDIHILPENFPRTLEALKGLLEAISNDAEALIESRGLPGALYPSIAGAVCTQMMREIEAQIKELNSLSPDNVETLHLMVGKDGTRKPMVSPVPMPNPKESLN